MKKSDLRMFMRVVFGDRPEEKCIVIKDRCNILHGVFEFGHARPIFYPDLYNKKDGACSVIAVYDAPEHQDEILNYKLSGELLWEHKEETPIVTLDGVDYSESTLRSLIKKATL